MPVLRFHESEVRRGKPSEVRKNRAKIGIVHPEPRSDSREVLVDRRGRNPAARARIIGTVDRKGRKFPVSLAANDGAARGIEIARAAEDQMMAAPAVIAPLPVARKRASEITGGEGRHVILQPELFHCQLEGHQRLA